MLYKGEITKEFYMNLEQLVSMLMENIWELQPPTNMVLQHFITE